MADYNCDLKMAVLRTLFCALAAVQAIQYTRERKLRAGSGARTLDCCSAQTIYYVHHSLFLLHVPLFLFVCFDNSIYKKRVFCFFTAIFYLLPHLPFQSCSFLQRLSRRSFSLSSCQVPAWLMDCCSHDKQQHVMDTLRCVL